MEFIFRDLYPDAEGVETTEKTIPDRNLREGLGVVYKEDKPEVIEQKRNGWNNVVLLILVIVGLFILRKV